MKFDEWWGKLEGSQPEGISPSPEVKESIRQLCRAAWNNALVNSFVDHYDGDLPSAMDAPDGIQ